MKNLFLLSVFVILLFSCKATYNTSSQNKLKGNWVITDVEYRGAAGITVKAFGDADAKCFKGSEWSFIPNNYTGNYTLLGSQKCPSGTTSIRWTISPDNTFGFKKIFEGDKAKNVTQGYNLKIQSQTDTSFELLDQSSIDGKLVQIVYYFKKA